MIMLLLSIVLTTTSVVGAFTRQPPGTITRGVVPPSYGHERNSPTPLRAAKRRGGAMARRKKPKNQTEDDDDGSGSSGGGFGRTTEESSPSESDSIYSMPPLYDLAFGYRSYEDEVDFLLHAHGEYSARASTMDEPEGRGPLKILELAAGPARHSLAALSDHPPSEVDSVLALDLSQAMVEYGRENANRELGAPGGRRDDFVYVNGDMRSVCDYTPSSFDAAWLLLGSMQHLLTNDDVLSCFASVSSVLKPGGTIIIELPHPRETFSMGECTRNGWTVPLEDDDENEYGELSVVWGEEDDEFDPVAQVRQFTVGMELTMNSAEDAPKEEDAFLRMSEGGKTKVREVVPMRLYTLQEIDALARCAGLEMVARYGALDEEVSIENEEEAFRMVCVLRKS